jgi:hypothetical protein
MEESPHLANISFERIRMIAEDVAQYAGRYFKCETFLGYSLKDVTPLIPQHADSIPPDGKVKIEFSHWTLLDEMMNSSGKPYADPETVTQRIMSYVVSAESLLDYKEYLAAYSGYDDLEDPDGDFDLLDWSDNVAVSDGDVPDDVVEALCKYLKNQPAGHLSWDFREDFLEGKLPKWDSRILKVVEEDFRKSFLEEEAYEAKVAAESPEEKIHREEVYKMSNRTISSCWITQEFNDTLDSLMDCTKRRNQTDDTKERDRIQSEMDSLISGGLVTMEDVARCVMLERQDAGES